VVAAAGTDVTIDGESVGRTPLADAVPVEPGAHTVKFRAADGATDTESVSVLAGDKAVAKFGAASSPSPTPPPTPPAGGGGGGTATPPTPPSGGNTTPPAAGDQNPGDQSANAAVGAETGKKKNLFAPPKTMVPVFIGGGVAVAGFLGLALPFAIAKGSAQDSATSVASQIRTAAAQRGISTTNPPLCSRTDAQTVQTFGKACQTLSDDNDKVNTDATIANIGIGVGIAGLVFAAGWYLFAPKKDSGEAPPAATRIVVSPMIGGARGLAISGDF
jgi:hypothetical protein